MEINCWRIFKGQSYTIGILPFQVLSHKTQQMLPKAQQCSINSAGCIRLRPRSLGLEKHSSISLNTGKNSSLMSASPCPPLINFVCTTKFNPRGSFFPLWPPRLYSIPSLAPCLHQAWAPELSLYKIQQHARGEPRADEMGTPALHFLH